MATTRDDISAWMVSPLFRQKGKAYSHMIVAIDTFDWEDFPVFVERGTGPNTEIGRLIAGHNLVMEVYNFNMPIGPQLAAKKRGISSQPACYTDTAWLPPKSVALSTGSLRTRRVRRYTG